MVSGESTLETKTWSISNSIFGPDLLLVQPEQLVSWAPTWQALSFLFVNTQSISISAQLVAIATASHAALAGINRCGASSESVSTPALGAPLTSEVRVAATVRSACLQSQGIAPQHILRQRTLPLAIRDAAVKLIVANGSRLLRTSQGRVVVQ